MRDTYEAIDWSLIGGGAAQMAYRSARSRVPGKTGDELLQAETMAESADFFKKVILSARCGIVAGRFS